MGFAELYLLTKIKGGNMDNKYDSKGLPNYFLANRQALSLPESIAHAERMEREIRKKVYDRTPKDEPIATD